MSYYLGGKFEHSLALGDLKRVMEWVEKCCSENGLDFEFHYGEFTKYISSGFRERILLGTLKIVNEQKYGEATTYRDIVGFRCWLVGEAREDYGWQIADDVSLLFNELRQVLGLESRILE